MSEKLEELKRKISESADVAEEFVIPIINEKVKLRKLTQGQLKEAQEWGDKNFATSTGKKTGATTAMICLSVDDDKLFPLTRETHDFFMSDDTPVELIFGLAKKILNLNGIDHGRFGI